MYFHRKKKLARFFTHVSGIFLRMSPSHDDLMEDGEDVEGGGEEDEEDGRGPAARELDPNVDRC